MGKRKVRLLDVATRAGVSVTTASLVLNNRDLAENVRISSETARQVRGIALEMGYLEKGIVGLIVPEIGNYFLPMIHGVMGVLREEDYSLAIGLATQWNMKDEIAEVRLMEEKGFDCLLIAPTPQFVAWSEKNPHLFQDKKRVVLMNWVSHTGIPYVTIDHAHCGYLATKHLLELGHRRIALSAFQRYPTEHYATDIPIVDARFRGYVRAMKEYDLPYISVTYAKDVFDLPEKATAVYCSRAREAAQFLGECWDRKMHIPEVLSVVGQDDDLDKTIVRPRVTSIDVRAYEVGVLAAHMALDLIDGRSVESATLSARLVERESVRAI